MNKQLRNLTSGIAIAVGSAVLFAIMGANSAQAADIVLRSQATPQSAVVRLGDVAEVRAENTRDADRLAAIPLMPAPNAGRARYLRMREVQDLVAAHGEEMSRHRFQGPTVVEIASPATLYDVTEDTQSVARQARREAWSGADGDHRSGDNIPHSSVPVKELRVQLTDVITEYLKRASGDDSSWRVELIATSNDLQLLPLATSPPTCEGGQAPWSGKQRFVVSFPTAQGNAQISVATDVTRQRPVVVTIQPIERGAIITAADVELQSLDDVSTASGYRAPIGSMEQIVGTEAARPLPAGHVVVTSDVQAQLLVKRGEEVTVYARGGGIQVRTLARARQNGARGELVQVESLETRERFDAVVVGHREAVVFAGNTIPSADVAGPSLRSPRR